MPDNRYQAQSAYSSTQPMSFRSHISLQKTVHLPARTQVPAYLLQHAFLSVRQLKGRCGNKAVEYIPTFSKTYPAFALPVFGITQYVQLDIEQFLEFQAVFRFSQHIRTDGNGYSSKHPSTASDGALPAGRGSVSGRGSFNCPTGFFSSSRWRAG